MNKFGSVIGLIVAIGAMLVIPSPIGQVAKASTCSASGANHHTGTGTISRTTSGSCSTASVSSAQGNPAVIVPHGGSKSSCSGFSTTQGGFPTVSSRDSNGAISCSAHSP